MSLLLLFDSKLKGFPASTFPLTAFLTGGIHLRFIDMSSIPGIATADTNTGLTTTTTNTNLSTAATNTGRTTADVPKTIPTTADILNDGTRTASEP